MTRAMPFVCSICEEESTHICLSCTKDTCGNHLCEKCDNCSDCCACELTLDHAAPPERPLVYKVVANTEEEETASSGADHPESWPDSNPPDSKA